MNSESIQAEDLLHIEPSRLTPSILADLAINAAVSNRSEFLRFLRARVQQEADAEDLLQDFYLKVLSKAGQIRDADAIGPWMKSVLRRTVIDYYRARAAETHAMKRMESANSELIADSTGDNSKDAARLEAALHRISPRYAQVLIRVDLRGEPRTFVSSDLAISNNNMGVLLHRARKNLRQTLADPGQSAPARRRRSRTRSPLISARVAPMAADRNPGSRWAGECRP